MVKVSKTMSTSVTCVWYSTATTTVWQAQDESMRFTNETCMVYKQKPRVKFVILVTEIYAHIVDRTELKLIIVSAYNSVF